MRVEPRPDSGPCFFATRHITFSAQQPFPFQSMLRRPPCVCLTPAIIHVNKCLLTLFSRLFAKMHPPPLPCSLSQSTVSSICRWRVSSNSFVNLARCFFFFFPPSVQRPSQEEWWVVYTLEMEQNCWISALKKKTKNKKTHVNFRGRMGKSG